VSAQTLTTRPARERTARQEARLRAVPPARSTHPKAPFVVLVLALLGGGLVGLLLLNTTLAQGAFTLRDLQRSGVLLSERQQALAQQLADEQEPAALARRARALGMVSGGAPAFVRLPDGKVLGTPRAAGTTPKPSAAAATLPPLPPTTAASTQTKTKTKATTSKAKAKTATKATTTKARKKHGTTPAPSATPKPKGTP
jgi:hypothetical protein